MDLSKTLFENPVGKWMNPQDSPRSTSAVASAVLFLRITDRIVPPDPVKIRSTTRHASDDPVPEAEVNFAYKSAQFSPVEASATAFVWPPEADSSRLFFDSWRKTQVENKTSGIFVEKPRFSQFSNEFS